MKKKLTTDKLELIEKYSASYSIDQLAKRFDVHPSYLKQVMIREGIYNIQEFHGFYTASSLGRAAGVSSETVRRWVHKYGLPYKRIARYQDTDPMRIYITIEDFWKWAESNQSLLSFRKANFDELAPVPRWAEKKKKQDLSCPPKQKIWTKAEENRLLFLYYQEGKTQKEIALQLGRSLSSVEKKIKRISDKKMKK